MRFHATVYIPRKKCFLFQTELFGPWAFAKIFASWLIRGILCNENFSHKAWGDIRIIGETLSRTKGDALSYVREGRRSLYNPYLEPSSVFRLGGFYPSSLPSFPCINQINKESLDSSDFRERERNIDDGFTFLGGY